MTCHRTPLQMLREARQIALDHGCFVAEKQQQRGPVWILYRANPNPDKKPIYIGKRNSPAAIRKYVEMVCLPRKTA